GNVLKQQHIRYSGRSSHMKFVFIIKIPGVFPCSKQHVINGNIPIVVGMDAPSMVKDMSFRPLYDVPQPCRRADIAVLEHTEKSIDQNYHGSCLRRKSGYQHQQEAA